MVPVAWVPLSQQRALVVPLTNRFFSTEKKVNQYGIQRVLWLELPPRVQAMDIKFCS